MKDEKYVVFKKEDFDKWQMEQAEPLESTPRPLDDAVVIRTKDLFAPPALDTYANSILVALSLMLPNDPRRVSLQAIADYFHARAVEGWQQSRTLPTP